MACNTEIFILTMLLFVFMQPLTVDIHYYYILELSFYLSLLFSQFTDIRRKVRNDCETHIMHPITFIIQCLSTKRHKEAVLVTFSNRNPKVPFCLFHRLYKDPIMLRPLACEHLLSASAYSH